jgi:solute carrier family 25 phosphate transporter 23/24/25/41
MSVVPETGANVRPTVQPSFQTSSHTQLQPLGAPDPTTLQKAREVLAQPVVASFVAGGVAGAVSRTVVSPLERLKILFQVQSVGREEYKMSVPKALAKMWREEGWRGFMAGNGTNCIRIVPYSAVQFSAYNVYKRVSSSFSQCVLLVVLPVDRH